jgi:hypothetical protein
LEVREGDVMEGGEYLFAVERELVEEGILCDLACGKVAADVDKGGEGAGGDAFMRWRVVVGGSE